MNEVDYKKALSTVRLDDGVIEEGGVGVFIPFKILEREIIKEGAMKEGDKFTQISIHEEGVVILIEKLGESNDKY